MTEFHDWHNKTLAEKVVRKLCRNFFNGMYFGTSAEATAYIMKQVTPGMQVAFGGSMTIRNLQIRQKAAEKGAILIDHGAEGLTDSQKLEVMRRELTSDLFISSTNAITADGILVNVDGYGNRVAAMIFGPQKVIVVAGINKIVKDEEAAFDRLGLVAGPMNMKRLNRGTPCTEDAVCHNCSAENRGCRAYTIIRKRPAHTPTDVIIVGENLGM